MGRMCMYTHIHTHTRTHGINAIPSLATSAKARVSLIIGRRATPFVRQRSFVAGFARLNSPHIPPHDDFNGRRTVQWRSTGGEGKEDVERNARANSGAKVYASMICFRFLIPLINPLSLIIAFLSRLFFVPDPARFRLRATLLAADARAVVPPGNSIPAVFCVLVRREQWTEGDRFTRYRASYAKCKRGNGLLVTMITSGRYFFFFFLEKG